jgi:hypothetical protein
MGDWTAGNAHMVTDSALMILEEGVTSVIKSVDEASKEVTSEKFSIMLRRFFGEGSSR